MKKRFTASFIGVGAAVLFVISIWGWESFAKSAPLWPPFIAIILALITRDVIISLFAGIWSGAIIALKPSGFTAFVKAFAAGFFKSIDTYVLKSIADSDHVSIILFTLIIGGTVGIVTASGGLEGFVSLIAGKIGTRIKTQIATYFLGIAIFFDDYSNCLIVGNMMRPLTDKFRISREKFSFIIDATAAPVSSLLLVSTWIGFELGLIGDAMKSIGIKADAYSVFLNSIPYRFYVIAMLIFIPLTIFMKREIGSMFEAEERAIKKGQTLRPNSKPLAQEDFEKRRKPPAASWTLAVIPIGVLVSGVIVGLIGSGLHALKSGDTRTLSNILGNANSFNALLWASLASSLAAMIMSVLAKAMTFQQTMDAWFSGLKSMLTAVVVLSLAWGIGLITKEIKTAQYVTELLGGAVSIWMLPAAIFLASATISFATGTSWGTMAILFPVALPLAHQIGGPAESLPYIYAVCGTILSGSVFGDHCSPISDTTILSSIGASIDHMDHVRTQMTYAFIVGGISVCAGYIPAGLGLNPWISNILCLVLMTAVIFKFGRRLPEKN